MKKLLATAALLALTACAQPIPAPICDREAQEWNKFDTVEDTCLAPLHSPRPVLRPDGDDPRDKPTPDDNGPDDDPTDDPEGPGGPDQPDDDGPDTPNDNPKGPKGNNGWGNGDQPAPTEQSRDHNNAENGGGSHRKHGQSEVN